jgi:hypothetical protein
MTTDDAVAQAQQLVTDAATTLRVSFARVQYGAHELDELANRLLTNQTAWAGASGIGGGYDPALNRVLLQVDPIYKDADVLVRAIEELDDPRVSLDLITPAAGGPQSRVDDSAPWTAGAKIAPAGVNTWCTLGWAWKLWSSNEVVGSTARHCPYLYWYNAGTYVGTVFSTKQAVDSALMRNTFEPPGYHASVFVGDQTTTVYRLVAGVDTSWATGDLIAMSGATSGLNVTSVRIPTYTIPATGDCAGFGGLTGVLMQGAPTLDGDSGGPWLTTQSGTGYAIAHGQHWGVNCAAGYAGSFFIKLNSISSAQGASIVLAF